MKVFLLATVFCLLTTAVIAQICPTADPGYIRQPRPAGQPANYPPAVEPACFQRGTNEAGSYAACILCHDYLRRNQA